MSSKSNWCVETNLQNHYWSVEPRVWESLNIFLHTTKAPYFRKKPYLARAKSYYNIFHWPSSFISSLIFLWCNLNEFTTLVSIRRLIEWSISKIEERFCREFQIFIQKNFKVFHRALSCDVKTSHSYSSFLSITCLEMNTTSFYVCMT